jgi:hypothetical protein
MAIRVVTDQKTGMSKISFVLADDVHDGPVSAVGSFNDWQPGKHRLVRRSNGTRSVSVQVAAGGDFRFRYLGSGGVWFDDPDAEPCADGGLVRT